VCLGVHVPLAILNQLKPKPFPFPLTVQACPIDANKSVITLSIEYLPCTTVLTFPCCPSSTLHIFPALQKDVHGTVSLTINLQVQAAPTCNHNLTSHEKHPGCLMICSPRELVHCNWRTKQRTWLVISLHGALRPRTVPFDKEGQ